MELHQRTSENSANFTSLFLVKESQTTRHEVVEIAGHVISSANKSDGTLLVNQIEGEKMSDRKQR